MKLVATNKAEQNTSAIDPWTGVHMGAGLAAGLMGASVGYALAGALIYEVFEQVAERDERVQKLFQTSKPEAMVNAAVDVAVFMGGWWLGRRWNETT